MAISKKQREHLNRLAKQPRTQRQIESARELCRELGKKYGKINVKKSHKLSRTQKQRDASRRACLKLHKLPRTQKQIEAAHKPKVFGDDIVCHHNDLCRGKLRPDDVMYISHREHLRLHAKLQAGYIGANKPPISRGVLGVLADKER